VVRSEVHGAYAHRLLVSSRWQTQSQKPANMNTLVARMEELVRRTVGPHIKVEVIGGERPCGAR
jgi:hypothetical protein